MERVVGYGDGEFGVVVRGEEFVDFGWRDVEFRGRGASFVYARGVR